MIDKPLAEITFPDVQQFVNEKWPEGTSLDYKRDAYGNSDADKKELLKDVSSFANTDGGDLIMGVDEDKGLPTTIPGIAVADIDKERLRLQEIIQKGLEPRIDFNIHSVPVPGGSHVLIVRVLESQISPHRVVFHNQFGEFWARTSAGKYSMTTDQLRRAFTLTAGIYDQIRAFRERRVHQIDGQSQIPVPMPSGGKLILHLIPVESFRSRQQFTVSTIPEMSIRFPPIGVGGWDGRLNLDGYVSFGGGEDRKLCRSYTQFYRTGIVEVVLAEVVQPSQHGGKVLLAGYYERHLATGPTTVARFLQAMRTIGVQPPVWVFLTLTGVKDARIPTDEHYGNHSVIDRDILLLPEFVINDLAVDPMPLLRPVFDLVWNASGYVRSFNFDQQNRWINR